MLSQIRLLDMRIRSSNLEKGIYDIIYNTNCTIEIVMLTRWRWSHRIRAGCSTGPCDDALKALTALNHTLHNIEMKVANLVILFRRLALKN